MKETTAYRQKGSSGVDKGIPDLLVGHPLLPYLYLGLEVKGPGQPVRFSSPEQKLAAEQKEFFVVRSSAEALKHAIDFIVLYAPEERSKGLAFTKATRTMGALERAPGGRS